MRSTLFEILSATAFVAVEAAIAAAATSWLALSPFLTFTGLEIAAAVIGGLAFLLTGTLFFRHARRVAATQD